MPRRRRSRRRFLRRLVLLGGASGAAWAWRNRQIDGNRRRFNLP